MGVLARETLCSAAQVEHFESLVFKDGLPVEALMEKAGLALFRAIDTHFPIERYPRVGVLAGPGHNGGDALVVARELLNAGRTVVVYCPVQEAKPLTTAHRQYFVSLGGQVQVGTTLEKAVDLWVDGLFGFGLKRPVEGPYAVVIEQINASGVPAAAIDLPSGLAGDTGVALGPAIRAERTYCLGLWKRGLWQDAALPYLGTVERIDLDYSDSQVERVIDERKRERLLLPAVARAGLPLARGPLVHKYTVGTTLIVSGSRDYGGAPLLCALGARASGTGMLYMAIPAGLRDLLQPQLPEAVFYLGTEDEAGGLAELNLNLDKYDAVVCGPGLSKTGPGVVERIVRESRGALVLDADGLNLLADHLDWLEHRPGPTVLTPHVGEFRRLFPDIALEDRLAAAYTAAIRSGAWLVLKGARTVVASPEGEVWVNSLGSPALARGGSGDVLSGLLGGLLSQCKVPQHAVLGAVWWHAHTGEQIARTRTVLGADPRTLAESLLPALTG